MVRNCSLTWFPKSSVGLYRSEISGFSSIFLFIVYIPAVIFLTCNNQPLFGLFDSDGTPISDGNILENDCNSKCGCQTDIFYPVCDTTINMTYITPCNAGCSSVANGIFQNCQCVPGAENLESISLVEDRCDTDCDTLWPFVTCFVFVFAFLYTPLPLAPSAGDSMTICCINGSAKLPR